jgi:thiamine biosynthesis lipoprotein ApbE
MFYMKWLTAVFFGALIFALGSSFKHSNPGPQLYVSSFENVLGTSFDLKVKAISEQRSDLAEKLALDEIDRLSSIVSSYDPNSEFSRWQRTRGDHVKISPDLFEVFRLFDQWRTATGGALDPAAGKIIQLWKEAEAKQELPHSSSLQEAILLVKQKHWELDSDKGTAIHLSSVPLVFNTFVKSYIISKVADKLMAAEGISAVVVNIGGDIVVRGDHHELIRVSDPVADGENDRPISTLVIGDKAIATSGNYRRGYSINGKWYSHIVDPRTGMPVDHILSAAVVADNAVDAGALATAFNVMRAEEAMKLAAEKGAEYELITSDGERISSKGWPALKAKPVVTAAPAIALKQGNWNKEYEVAVTFELMRFEGRSRRPFVAVWVEDGKKKTVRTVALWFNKPRWLPDLKEWFHKNSDTYQNGTKDVFSISSATRPPGTYTIKWDGKDEAGEFVNSGTYTVYIEVAREHGTYQLIKQEVICKNKAQKFVLAGNAEVSSASVEYRKVETSQ